MGLIILQVNTEKKPSLPALMSGNQIPIHRGLTRISSFGVYMRFQIGRQTQRKEKKNTVKGGGGFFFFFRQLY